MRVITGTARGAKLITLEGNDVRPTSGRVKEAVFSMIQFELEGRRVLDLFAGSGQLGIEALSRGASHAVFVDQSGQSAAVVRQNLQNTNFAGNSTVVLSDCIEYLSRCGDRFDIVFIDPPYGKGLAAKALALAAPLVSSDGVILCETASADPMPEQAGGFTLVNARRYGKTSISVYRGA